MNDVARLPCPKSRHHGKHLWRGERLGAGCYWLVCLWCDVAVLQNVSGRVPHADD